LREELSDIVTEEAVPPPNVTLMALFLSFLKLGMTSFGGGIAGWTHREMVDVRGWMTDDKFLKVLTIAQVLPGANPVNMAVYIGVQLRGYPGALVAMLGMVAMPFFFILFLAYTYRLISDYPPAQAVFLGLACVGIASMVLVTFKTSKRLRGNYLQIAIAAFIFLAIVVFSLPMVWVVLFATPISILVNYLFGKGAKSNG
jgi:chromate transporter